MDSPRSTHTRELVRALLLLVLAVVLWGFMVAIGVPGQLPGLLLHPRIWSRALASSILLVVGAAWHLLAALRRRGGHSAVGEPASIRSLIPLALVLLLIPAAARQSRMDYRNLELTGTGSQFPATAAAGNEDLLAAVDAALSEGGSALRPDRDERRREIDAILTRPDPLVISEDEYSRVVDLIWDAPHRFSGRVVEFVAFTFRRPEWAAEYYTAARLSIWCCVADAAVVGILAESDPWSTPGENDWIRIRGELGVLDQFDTGSVTMRNVPVMINPTWESVPPPDFEYVFPADW